MHVVGMPCSEYDIESDLLFAPVKITDHEEEEEDSGCCTDVPGMSVSWSTTSVLSGHHV